MDDAEAREALLAPRVLDAQGFRALGHALDGDGPPLAGGASPAWVGEILRLQARDHEISPPSMTFEARMAAHRPFVAEWSWVDAEGRQVRSFEAGDLPAEAEISLRALAQASGNQAVRARLFDVLWLRFGNRDDAAAAADAYLARLAELEPLPFLNDRFDAIGRAGALVAAARSSDRLPALAKAFEALAAHKTLKGESALPLTTLATSFGAPVLTDDWARESLRYHLEVWVTKLEAAAEGRNLHGHSLRLTAARWFGLLGQVEERELIARSVVSWMIARYGRFESPAKAPLRVREVRAIAESFGLGDLASACTKLLPSAIEASLRDRAPSAVPETVVDRGEPGTDLPLDDPRAPALALRRLCLEPDLLEFPFEKFDDLRPKGDGGANAWPGKPTIWFRGGRPSPPPDRAESSYAFALESAVGFHHLGRVETTLRQFLRRVVDHLDDTTLFSSLGGWPALGRAQASVLAAASERFARRDWLSAGALIATAFGAVLRSRMGAVSKRPVPEGGWVGPDEALPSLLRRADVRDELGRNFVDFVEFVLCRPDCGPMLYNRFVHGTMNAERLDAPDVLLLWLLLLRVICSPPRNATPALGT